MPRFLIEVEHDATPVACIHAVELFLRTGSHFLTHADWGCMDGEHKAFLIMEFDTRHEALNVVPAEYRPRTRVVQLNTFDTEHLAELHRKFGTPPS